MQGRSIERPNFVCFVTSVARKGAKEMRGLIVVAVVLIAVSGSAQEIDIEAIAKAIRTEAVRKNDDPAGRPLPLAGHWNTGHYPRAQGMDPAFEIGLVEKGHYVLPSFHHQPYWHKGWASVGEKYYGAAIKKAAILRLPLTFLGTQWERGLTDDQAFFGRPADKNPNVITPDGKILKKVSPFGPVDAWREVGRKWTATPAFRKLQEQYPEPPRVIFLSNNEHAKLRWHQAETSKRYVDKHGLGKSDNFKRKVIGAGWIERYRALQAGMREGLTSKAWKKNAIFVGYEAFGPAHFGRWGGWKEYSLILKGPVPQYSVILKGRVTPWPLAWDGGTPSYYVHNWNPSTDYTVWSPHVESNNWPFMLDEAWKLNPKFWWEVSVWDGYQPKLKNCMRKTYAKRGQTYGPERYRGFVQFGMWLLRPRVVREFRGWTDDVKTMMPYYKEILASVKLAHENKTLREFWRNGKLVPNRAQKHPYQQNIPAEYRNVERWFLLDTSLTPKRPWTLNTEIPVWAIALVIGRPPKCTWLVYAQSPVRHRKNVKIAIGLHRKITVDVSVGGSFYAVDGPTGRVRSVSDRGRP